MEILLKKQVQVKNLYRIPKDMKLEIRYAKAAMTQEKEMTFDFTFDSLSKTAMDVIQDTTKVISAIKVIRFMIAAHPRQK